MELKYVRRFCLLYLIICLPSDLNPILWIAGEFLQKNPVILGMHVVLYLTSGFFLMFTWNYERSLIRDRILSGHCPQCGYDWRTTPRQCSECGRIPRRFRAS